MSTLYIMVGQPGSGKSSYAKTLQAQLPDCVIVSRDEIRFNLVKENEDYFSKEKQVIKTFKQQIQKNLQFHENVIADATHIYPKGRLQVLSWAAAASKCNRVVAVILNTSLEQSYKNNEKRKGTRGYISDRKVIFNMFKQLKNNPVSIDEGFDAICYVRNSYE